VARLCQTCRVGFQGLQNFSSTCTHTHTHTRSYIHINMCIYEMHDLINLGLCVLMAMFRTVLNTRGVTAGI
jgi:hypothetical protein